MIRVALNGFGRIGRLTARALLERPDSGLEIVAINDLADVATSAHLMKYDSVHGIWQNETISASPDALQIGAKRIPYFQEKNPSALPWGKLGVDVVLECSGFFTKRTAAAGHLAAGAKRVLISAPAEGADLTVVYGVNHLEIGPDDLIISNASCTTNCLAPVALVLHKAVGIEAGFMTTIHSYTGDQRLIDTAHSDLRRARAGALNMIPTSTGAAKAVGLVLPDLAGRLDGVAVRVPTANVSLVDLTFTSQEATTTEIINAAIQDAAGGPLKGVLEAISEPLVSSDFIGNPASSIFDLTQTQVVGDHFVRVLSWYDNEWGFANRMVDVARVMGKTL